MRKRTLRTVTMHGTIAALAAMTMAGCGGDDSTSPSGGTGGPVTATITITNNTVSPSSVTVTPGSRVTFVNNDSQNHDMNSDPHPEHTSCPEINVGFMQPGQSRTTQNLTIARTCGFHDHLNPDTASLRGSIRTQ